MENANQNSGVQKLNKKKKKYNFTNFPHEIIVAKIKARLIGDTKIFS